MKQKINNIILAINGIIMAIFIAIQMKDTVPIHFGVSGEADSYGSKWTYLIFAIIPFILIWTYSIYIRKIDFENKEHNKKIERGIVVGISYFFAVLGWVFALFVSSGKEKIDDVILGTLVSGILGIFLVGISNYYGKIKKNHYLGIRLPWTLSDEENWNKTHRFSGYLGVASGILILIWTIAEYIFKIIPFYISAMIIIGTVIVVMVIIPIIYSYRLYRKSH
jgi:uncharacterized membrane protein